MLQTIPHQSTSSNLKILVLIAVFLLALSLSRLHAQELDILTYVEVVDSSEPPRVVSRSVVWDPFQPDEVTALGSANGMMFILRLRPEGFLAPDWSLGFPTADCTGMPFLFQHTDAQPILPRFFSPAAIAPPGHTLYLPDEPETLPFDQFIGSRLFFDGCHGVRLTFPAFPAQAAMDLTQFVPPFRIQPGHVPPHKHRQRAGQVYTGPGIVIE